MSCTTDFERLAQFSGSGCEKYDRRKAVFGRDDIVPLWVADMDFPAPDCVTDALRARLEHAAFGYVAADDAYHAAIVDWLAQQHGWQVVPEAIVPLPGVVPGMALAIQTFTQPDDSVIVQPPVYRPFLDLPGDNDRQRLDNPLLLENGRYRFDLEQLEQVAAQARMLLLCNPHNPGGRAWTPAELQALAQICAQHDILVVADEIHMDLIHTTADPSAATGFDAAPHDPTRKATAPEKRSTTHPRSGPTGATFTGEIAGESNGTIREATAATGSPAANEIRHTPFGPIAEHHGCRWISVTAPGKTFNTAGIGGGYAIVPNADLRRRYQRTRRALHCSDTDVFSRVALLAAYENGRDWPATLMRFIGAQRERVRTALAGTAVHIIEPDATYLLWLDCRELGVSNNVHHDPQNRALRSLFVDEARVGLSEGVWFGPQGAGFMRMNLATPPQVLETALTRIRAALDAAA